MKCDRLKPHCSSCIKNNTTESCVYEDQPWIGANENITGSGNNEDELLEIQRLKEQIRELQRQNEDLQTQLLLPLPVTDTEPATTNEDNDPISQLTQNFDLLMLKEAKMSHFGSTSLMAVVSNDPILRQILDPFTDFRKWGISLEKFYLYDQEFLMKQHHEQQVDMCNFTEQDGPPWVAKPGMFQNDMSENDKELVEKINCILPPLEIVYGLIDYFFKVAYCFVPIIDEDSFRKNMESLLIASSNGKAVLVVTNANIFASVAVLLCVLRFSYITLPLANDNNSQQHIQVTELVKRINTTQTTVSPTFIEYAKSVLTNSNALRKPTLKHIQALLVIRVYRQYSPEDTDESSDSTIYLAMIIQMAKMHGMHRDPLNFPAVKNSRQTVHIWRKIWLMLMNLDVMQSFTFGCPLIIRDENEYDTKLPSLVDSSGTRINDIERQCVISMIKTHEVTLLLRDITGSFTKIKNQPKRSDIEKMLSRIEGVLLRYCSLDDLCVGLDTEDKKELFVHKVDKVRDILNKITLYQAVATCQHILMLTCPSEDVFLVKKYISKSIESTLICFKFALEYADSITSETANRFKGVSVLEIFMANSVFDNIKKLIHIFESYQLRYIGDNLNLEKVVASFTLPDSQNLKTWLTLNNEIKFSIGDVLNFKFHQLINISLKKLSWRYFIAWVILNYVRMFSEYFKEKFPEMASLRNTKLKHIISSITNKTSLISTTSNEQDLHSIPDFWTKFVDSANQSKFDYLSPNLQNYQDFNTIDPFFNTSPSAIKFDFNDTPINTSPIHVADLLTDTSSDFIYPMNFSDIDPNFIGTFDNTTGLIQQDHESGANIDQFQEIDSFLNDLQMPTYP